LTAGKNKAGRRCRDVGRHRAKRGRGRLFASGMPGALHAAPWGVKHQVEISFK